MSINAERRIMRSFWSQWRRKQNHAYHKPRSAAAQSFVSYQTADQPVWTPHRYADLCEEGYLKNVIVYRCISLIARNLASVSLFLKEKGKTIPHHPLINALLHEKDGQSASIMEEMVSYLMLCGNAYLECHDDQEAGRKNTPHFRIIRPDRVYIHADEQAIKAYEIREKETSRFIPVNAEKKSALFHLKLFHPLHDFYGMSPLRCAASSIDQHNAVGAHNLALLQNGGRPSGAFIIKPTASGATLSEEQRHELRSDLQRLYEGQGNAGRVMMLEGDFDWKEMGLSPKDLDFLSGKHLSAREIAQAFGVPPMLVGVPGDATFANYKEARFRLWEDTLIPLLEKIIKALENWLSSLFCERIQFTYDRDAIPALRSKRDGLWSVVSKADFLTTNEKRELLGFSPLSSSHETLMTMENNHAAKNNST